MTIEDPFELQGLVRKPETQLDLRPEDEIIADLNAHSPVISERNIWAYWDKGFDAMPPWQKRNVINWVRREGKSWTIRVLDYEPGSPNHISRFINPDYLPTAVNEDRMEGGSGKQHTSDFVRLAALYQHGGVWLDVSVLLFRDLDDLWWSALEDPTSPYQMGMMWSAGGRRVLNHAIAARRHNPCIYRWLQVFLEIWTGRDRADGLHSHPLLHHLPPIDVKFNNIPLNIDPRVLGDYLVQLQAFLRVQLNREPGPNGFDGPAYFRNHVFLVFASDEVVHGYFKERESELLTRPYTLRGASSETDRDDQEFVRKFVVHSLSNTSMMKVSSGFKIVSPRPDAIGTRWNRPGHGDDDCRPGTWAEVLRYGSVYLHQMRKILPMVAPEDIGEVTEVGTLEAVVIVSGAGCYA